MRVPSQELMHSMLHPPLCRRKDGRTQEFNIYQCYIGSSKYNTKEMYQLIINTLQKLDENGVRDSEVEAFRRKYEK